MRTCNSESSFISCNYGYDSTCYGFGMTVAALAGWRKNCLKPHARGGNMKNGNKAESAPHCMDVFKGVVIPAEWDDETGNHTAVALSADDEKEYRISVKNAAGRILLHMIHQHVRINGFIDTGGKGDKREVITVESYQVLEYSRD